MSKLRHTDHCACYGRAKKLERDRDDADAALQLLRFDLKATIDHGEDPVRKNKLRVILRQRNTMEIPKGESSRDFLAVGVGVPDRVDKIVALRTFVDELAARPCTSFRLEKDNGDSVNCRDFSGSDPCDSCRAHVLAAADKESDDG